MPSSSFCVSSKRAGTNPVSVVTILAYYPLPERLSSLRGRPQA